MEVVQLLHYRQAAAAIRDMTVRGAPLIGVTAAYGMWLAAAEAASSPPTFAAQLRQAATELKAARPTAVNLAWAVDRCLNSWAESQADVAGSVALLRRLADQIRQEDIDQCRAIGEQGLSLIQALAARKPAGEPVRILTHCNAGWLGCIDYGTATAPIYLAQDAGIPLQVWVDETRPRNQGKIPTQSVRRSFSAGVAYFAPPKVLSPLSFLAMAAAARPTRSKVNS